MARWQPDNAIGKNEKLGRRLFDEPVLIGATDQNPYEGLSLRHFEETRDTSYSLDRLGRSGIDGAVINYLRPRAELGGTRFSKPKTFNGWATIKAGDALSAPRGPKIELFSSPVVGQGYQENIYHAHADRPVDVDGYTFALHLKYLFETKGGVEVSVKLSPVAQKLSLWQRVRNAWMQLFAD